MQWLLCELMGPVLRYLDPLDFGRLQLCSRELLRATGAHEEEFLSRTRLVRVYRRGCVAGGMLQLTCMRGGSSERLELPVLGVARAIIGQLWDLKRSRDDVRCTLFVDCVLWPDLDASPVPCYLFKTDAAARYLLEHYGADAIKVDFGWPVWISCHEHPFRRCRSCPYPRHERNFQPPVHRPDLLPATLIVW
jgi:hypothetical protein